MMHAEGINFHRMETPLTDIAKFDMRLRQQLYDNYDYQDIRQQLLDHIQTLTLYIVSDTFETSYMIFRDSAKSEDPEAAFIFIGPYLTNRIGVVLPQVADRIKFPAMQIGELKNYYNGVPCLLDFEPSVLESQIVVLVKYIFDTHHFRVDRTNFSFGDQIEATNLKIEPSTRLTMDMIEERYKNEDGLLEAIGRGDVQTALLHMSNFRKFQIDRKSVV